MQSNRDLQPSNDAYKGNSSTTQTQGRDYILLAVAVHLSFKRPANRAAGINYEQCRSAPDLSRVRSHLENAVRNNAGVVEELPYLLW